MVPYLILCVAVTIFGFFLCEKNATRKKDIIFLAVVSVALIAMSTIRGMSVGVDYEPYLAYFQQVVDGGWTFLISPENMYRHEFGYSLINFIISLFGQTQAAFALGISILSVGLTAVFLYKHSSSVWVSMFIFISFGFFGYTLCTLRNQIAICIFMFALPFMQKKKLLPYMLIVLLCATFHNSMLVLLPLYFIVWIPLNWKSLAVYSAGTLLFIAFSEPIMGFVTQFVYTEYQVGTYYMDGRDFRTGFIPIALFLVLFLLKKPLLEHNEKNLPYLNLTMYTALLYCMTFKHFVFQRFGLMLLPVAMLILPELLCMLRPDETKLQELTMAKQALNSASGGAKKQALVKYNALSLELRDKHSMYWAALGFTLFGGFLYYLFLLQANRLLLVPYVIM